MTRKWLRIGCLALCLAGSGLVYLVILLALGLKPRDLARRVAA